MFKKGQLVQSLDTGVLYLITKVLTEHVMVVRHDENCGDFHMRLGRLKLIGNNYRAKQKCSR